MVRGAGSPPRSHHVGEKKDPVKKARSHGLSKEEAKRKKTVRSVKGANLSKGK